jgi:hypothetical protein
MVKVNLLPKEDLDKKAVGKFLKWTLSYGRYIIISVELVVFLVFFSRFIYDQKLANIHERVEQKQAIVASAVDFEEKIRSIQTRIGQVKSLQEGRTIYLTVLDKLKEIIPKDMIFTSIEFNENKILLEGETLSNESFARLITDLKLLPALFSEISIDSVDQKKGDEEVSIIKNSDARVVVFKISAQIEGYRIEPTPTIAPIISEQPENIE